MRHSATQWYLVTWSEDDWLRRMVTQDKIIAKESVKRLRAEGHPAQLARLPHYIGPAKLISPSA